MVNPLPNRLSSPSVLRQLLLHGPYRCVNSPRQKCKIVKPEGYASSVSKDLSLDIGVNSNSFSSYSTTRTSPHSISYGRTTDPT
ncbi:hypothetical protein Scep_009936 [Stephania cephalantha]|uniref:Uncharacterized protein n=1 Tax=Stephania cephalantha TaxID=152367 RepID=A0AAP0JV48_9MAGN